MDRFGEWRSIEPEGDEKEKASLTTEKAGAETGKSDRLRLYAVLAGGVLAVAGAAIWLTSTGAAASTGSLAINAANAFVPSGASASVAPSVAASIVVDVQGAVKRPGVHQLLAGTRVADAIAAAGGYSPQVDITRAAAELNLAAVATDGSKIQVPLLGEPPASISPGGDSTTGAAGGLINVNTATADELDTLPGVGPVTAEKIIEARTEAPFESVDELLSRTVLGASTFENLRALVTVGP